MSKVGLTFREYQELARTTAIYPNVGKNFVYPALGLAGEAGEVVEKVKKILRDEKGKVTQHLKRAIAKELGDVLWYVAMLAYELGLDLEKVAKENLKKLKGRKERGTLHGEGDER